MQFALVLPKLISMPSSPSALSAFSECIASFSTTEFVIALLSSAGWSSGVLHRFPGIVDAFSLVASSSNLCIIRVILQSMLSLCCKTHPAFVFASNPVSIH